MTYPIDEEAFLRAWIDAHDYPPDKADMEFGKAVVGSINHAYRVGKEEGIRIGARLSDAAAGAADKLKIDREIVMEIMYTIPAERYDRMLRSYDEAMEELAAIRAQLCNDGSGVRLEIERMLNLMDDKQIRRVSLICAGMLRGGA